MELWYYLFEVKFYDDYDTPWEDRTERGLICAPNMTAVMTRLIDWYGEHIYDIRIYNVEMDTNEILLERNFPGLIEMMENPIE